MQPSIETNTESASGGRTAPVHFNEDERLSMNASEEQLTAEALAGGTLTFNYFLAPGIDFQTIVTGNSRDTATVAVIFIDTPMWVGTLTPGLPSETFPTLSLGNLTLSDGEVTLKAPTPKTDGHVLLKCTVERAGQKAVPFAGIISKWPLDSSA